MEFRVGVGGRGQGSGVRGQKLEFRVGVGEWRVRSRRWSEGSSERIRRIRRGFPDSSDTLH